MASEFYHIISRVSMLTDFPLMVYEPECDKLLRYKIGESQQVAIPQALAPSLADEEKIISLFTKNGAPVIAYFLRFNVIEGKRVIVISDTKARTHLNRFFAALSQCCIELEQEKEKIHSEAVARATPNIEAGNTPAESRAPSATSDDELLEKDILINSLKAQLSKLQSGGQHAGEAAGKLAEFEELINVKNSEVEKLTASIAEKAQEIDVLKTQLSTLQSGGQHEGEDTGKLAEFEELINVKNSETEKLKLSIAEKIQQIDILSVDLSEMADLVKIVKKSRDKHCALVDGIFMPMYSITKEMKLLHGNRALAEFLGIQNISKVIGKYCYQTIFGFNAPCEWCRKNEVESQKSPATSAVAITRNGRACSLDLTGFPILDHSGEFVEYGEFFEDKTDKVEMMSTINKFREQIKTFKRAKITEMNEVQDVRKAYDELSANYDLVVERNKKMSRALEALMGQESTKEIIAVRSELNDYKHKLTRAADTIKNYQRNVDELKEKYADLNKRIFFQADRLVNTVSSRYNPPVPELKAAIDALSKDFDMIREFFKGEGAKQAQK